MRDLTINKHQVKIYDSIDELPIHRFHKFNKYALVDGGVGSDLNDLNSKIGTIKQYVAKKDLEKASMELENMRQGIYLIMQETNIKHLSYMTLIKSVDGKEVTDLSDEGVKKLLELFEPQPLGFFESLFQGLKKKLTKN